MDDAPVGFIFKPSKKDTVILYTALKDTNNTYAISVGRYISSKQLPVSLVSFSAVNQDNKVRLNWNTATELNTNHFIVQRSTDGINYTNIGTVQAVGSGAGSYQFTDASATNSTNYYRLEIVDADGEVTYSKVIGVSFTVNRLPFTVAPNPAREVTTIKGNHIVAVEIIDNLGRILQRRTFQDANNPSLTVSSLQAGLYHLRIHTLDGKVSSVGFVKE